MLIGRDLVTLSILRRVLLASERVPAHAQRHAASITVGLLTLVAVIGGHGGVSGRLTGDGANDSVPASLQRAQFVSATSRYSPFDDVFRRYAGDEAGNDELIAIIAAATFPESGWNPERVGDNGLSVGLFQIHQIHGLSWPDRADPDRASAFMVPRFIEAYREAKLTHPGLSGADLASLVAAMAERPEGWTDPTSIARTNYRESYLRLLSAVSRA